MVFQCVTVMMLNVVWCIDMNGNQPVGAGGFGLAAWAWSMYTLRKTESSFPPVLAYSVLSVII